METVLYRNQTTVGHWSNCKVTLPKMERKVLILKLLYYSTTLPCNTLNAGMPSV